MVLVAVEQSFPEPQRIIDDGLAVRMLPFGAMMFVRFLGPRRIRDWLIGLSEKSNSGIWGGLLCRKRHIDEKVAASRNEIDAVVSLGAGFDTRSFRLPELTGLPVWEIDQRENIAAISTATTWVEIGVARIPCGHTNILCVGSSYAIPDRARRAGDLRLARHGCTGQPPCLHLCPQELSDRQESLRLVGWLQAVCRNQGLAAWDGARGLCDFSEWLWLAADRGPW